MAWPDGGITLTVKNMTSIVRKLGNGVLTDKEQQLITFKDLKELKIGVKLQNEKKIQIIDDIPQDILDLLATSGIVLNPPASVPDTGSNQKLAFLLDVDTSDKTDGNFLRWENATKKFVLKKDMITSQLEDKALKTEVDAVDAKIDAVDTKVTNIGNASPKGVYATLAELQAAFPSGAIGIYLVTADGKWYYWNSTSWTPGGIYQSTGISPNSLVKDYFAKKSVDRTVIDGLTLSPNLYNPKTATPDTQQIAGTAVTSTSYNLSEFIEVEANQQYIISYARSVYCSYFDNNKQYVSSPTLGSGVVSENYVITIPANVKYIRLNVYKTPTSPYMFAKGNVTLPYEPYYTYADFLDIRNETIERKHIKDLPNLFDDGQLDPKKILGFKRSGNLFDKAVSLSGFYVNDGTGPKANASYALSDYIPMTSSDTVIISYARGNYAAFYDANKSYIGVSNFIDTANPLNNYTITIPANTAYARFNVYSTVIDTFMVVKNESIPAAYTPYIAGAGSFDTIVPKQKSIGGEHVKDESIERKHIKDLPNLFDDGQLDPKKILGFKRSGNLFDKAASLSGFYANDGTGPKANASYSLSDYITMTSNDTVVISYARGNYATFYDINKTYIGVSNFIDTANPLNNYTITIPANTAYARFNVYSTVLDTFMVVKNESIPLTYTPFVAGSGYFNTVVPKQKSIGAEHLKDGVIGTTVSKWSGKKANFLGDSITYGYLLSSTNLAWPNLVGQRLGLSTVRNYGISGSSVSAGGSNPMVNRYNSMDDDADIIFFMGGRNDFGSGTDAFGTIDSLTSATNTFYGALKNIAEGLKNKYPTKTIVFVTPPHGSSTSRPENVANTTTGKLYKEYVQAIRDVASLYGIPCCDIWNISGIQPLVPIDNTTFFLQSDGTTMDGVHPNNAGHSRIADRVVGFVNTL